VIPELLFFMMRLRVWGTSDLSLWTRGARGTLGSASSIAGAPRRRAYGSSTRPIGIEIVQVVRTSFPRKTRHLLTATRISIRWLRTDGPRREYALGIWVQKDLRTWTFAGRARTLAGQYP
jgi:hypothetical protein